VLAQPYLAVLDDHPEARRTVEEVERFSPPPRGFVSAPRDNLVWGEATAGVRDTLPWGPEQTLFPGLAILVLAGLGALRGPWPRGLRIGLVAAAAAFAFLSTGLRIADGWLGYRWLYEWAPGWDGLRTPGRLNTFTSLVLALLAAAGAELVAARAARRRALAGAAAGTLLAAVVVVEGLGPPPVLRVPDEPQVQASVREPQLHLPLANPGDFTDYSTFQYMLWSTRGFPRIVNGTSGFTPRLIAGLGERVGGFPDRRSIDYLRGLGVASVVFHPRPDAPAPSRERAERLGLDVRRAGGVVVYELPGERTQMLAPSSLHASR
jgi:hypothetical protein